MIEARTGSGMDNQRVKKQENGDVYLPSEITIDILSRLPIQTIIMCKVVCKSWCNLVTSLEFAKSHLSRSVPGLLVVSQKLGELDPQHKFFEFVDEIDPCFHGIFNFKFPHVVHQIRSSVDGLLALGNGGICLYICNPVTREYINLPLPPSPPGTDIIGFGVSKITGQYKLVRIAPPYSKSPNCEVYTLGTGSWRSIAADSAVKYYRSYDEFVFLKGILHCLASYSNNVLGISCFDLETELFSSFSIPSLDNIHPIFASLITLRDRLCLCHYSFDFGEISIWLMKEYGDDRLWIKEFVINTCRMVPFFLTDFRVFIDGDILMAEKYGPELVRFSPETNTIRRIHVSGLDDERATGHPTTKVVYTPSFLPVLKNLVMEDVTSF